MEVTTMKKIRLTALVMIFVFAFTLMGCAAGNDAEKEELEAKVEQLEKQRPGSLFPGRGSHPSGQRPGR